MSNTDEQRARNREKAARYRARLRAQNPPVRRPGENDRWDKPYRVLSEEQVSEIRRRCAAGDTYSAVAAAFGVSDSHVSRIVRGRRRRGQPCGT